MIKLTLKNGCEIKWLNTEQDYYEKVIAIRKDNKMVGLYNVDNVISTIVKSQETKAFYYA